MLRCDVTCYGVMSRVTEKAVTCYGVLSHVTECCYMLRCAVTCYGVRSPCTICIRACRRSFITCYILPAASPLLHPTAGASRKLTRASHEPLKMIRVGKCFEWSELEPEIFETLANSYHVNGCSAGLSTLNAKMPSVKPVPAGQG